MVQRDGLKINGKFHDENYMKRIFQKESRAYHSTAEGDKITTRALLAPILHLHMHPHSLLCDFAVSLTKVDEVSFPFVFIWPCALLWPKEKV